MKKQQRLTPTPSLDPLVGVDTELHLFNREHIIAFLVKFYHLWSIDILIIQN